MAGLSRFCRGREGHHLPEEDLSGSLLMIVPCPAGYRKELQDYRYLPTYLFRLFRVIVHTRRHRRHGRMGSRYWLLQPSQRRGGGGSRGLKTHSLGRRVFARRGSPLTELCAMEDKMRPHVYHQGEYGDTRRNRRL